MNLIKLDNIEHKSLVGCLINIPSLTDPNEIIDSFVVLTICLNSGGAILSVLCDGEFQYRWITYCERGYIASTDGFKAIGLDKYGKI